MTETPDRAIHPGRLPDDPAAFVSAAERITNAHDFAAAVAVYADDVRLEFITDGAFERYDGRAEASVAWQGAMTGLAARDFTLRKSLLTATDGVIVNTWRGTIAGRQTAIGVETWRFDHVGDVREHQLYNYLSVKPATSVSARLRLAFAYPVTALTVLREQRRAKLSAR